MQWDAWMHAAWWCSFRQIRILYWLLIWWLLWHNSHKFCSYILSLIYLLLSYITVIDKPKSTVLAILQSDLGSRTFTWCIRPLHRQQWIVMSHNFVTDIKNTLTHSKIGAQIPFYWHLTSKIPICLTIPALAQEPSSCLCSNPISIWWFAAEAKCKGTGWLVEKASHLEWVINRAPRCAK